MISTTAQALKLLRQHDAVGLYDTLEQWQQNELLCLLRRIINSLPRNG